MRKQRLILIRDCGKKFPALYRVMTKHPLRQTSYPFIVAAGMK